MKRRISQILAITLVTLLAITSCGPSKQLSSKKLVSEANALAVQGSYNEALAKYISALPYTSWDSITCRTATLTAQKCGKDSLVCQWGTLFRSTGDAEKLSALNNSLVALNRNEERTLLIIDNDAIFNSIIGESEVAKVEAVYFASNNDARLTKVFEKVQDKDVRAEVFPAFFRLKKKETTKTSELVAICKQELKLNPNTIEALRYVAKAKYDQANSAYDKTMGEYNKNKSQAAYAYMVRDLKKIVTPAYREARDYYERLSKLEPENTDNIKYLINIYVRLDNKAKVKELQKKI